MKKRDKLKNLFKKSLFGEKLENALQNKTDAEKPPAKFAPKPSAPPIKSRSTEKTPSESKVKIPTFKNQTETLSVSKSEPASDETILQTQPKSIKSGEFRQTMENGFLKNVSSRSSLKINLGIDLGTSFSKVVWRSGANSFPLCFGSDSSNLNDYLAPSVVAFGKNTLFCCKETAENETFFSLANFKMCLACESDENSDCSIEKCSLTRWHPKAFGAELKGDEAAFVNAFFLAKLLARTKKRVVAELENKGFGQPFEVKWTANFSVPDKFIEHSPIAAAFEKAFRTAWLMSEVFLEKSDVSKRQTIFEIYLAAKKLRKELETRGEPFDCFSYSEVGAEVASIVLSRTSESGLYAFVDIGAGTVDASVFRFWRDGAEAQRPPYAAEVFKLGAAHIETRANRVFAHNLPAWLKKLKEEYFGLAESERGKLLDPIITILKKVGQEVNQETYDSLVAVFRQAFEKESGKERESWQNLKLVLGGGGAKLKTYQDAAIRAFTLKDAKNPKSPETVILPKPADFQTSLPESEFHRFAVAYGLSHEIINLPEIIFAKDVAPMTQLKRKIRADRDDDR